ncbi:receptor tyrosine-protein kinase erbB-3 [Calypte anna]|uniref:receptor tyrosine-protein kinase erbB-3 n=1 Tax=Calypte anna TaxID=9244 RepID=UPI0011C47332|nr:receptor tyrosine-protein kinase erbB-3 [Calypte anna]
MIDENIRPTFKELANEFTRMARDPPRYLVIKQENGTAPPAEPPTLSDKELDEMETLELEEEEEELDASFGLTAGLYPPRPRGSCTRSPSLLSPPAGYIPMNHPGLSGRQSGGCRPPRRSRQESLGRTVSESSEGRGTASELDLAEGGSLSGSLCRSLRSRGDSAYLSQRESFPPLPPSSEGSEEDANGYVTPNCTARETDPTGGSVPELEEEYEYMNRRPGGLPGAPQPRPDSLEELGYEYMEVGSEPPPGSPPGRGAGGGGGLRVHEQTATAQPLSGQRGRGSGTPSRRHPPPPRRLHRHAAGGDPPEPRGGAGLRGDGGGAGPSLPWLPRTPRTPPHLHEAPPEPGGF